MRVQVGDANATANFEIADVRIVYSPLSRCFVKAENESAWAPMDSVKKLSYKKAGSSTFVLQEISDDCYMSDKDMQNTFLSMYKERATGQKFVHAGSFALSQAVTMQQVLEFAAEHDPQQLLMPIDAVFSAHPPLIVTMGQAAKLKNGAQVKDWQFSFGTYRVYAEDGEFLLLGRVENGVLTTIKSFFEVNTLAT